MENFTNLIFDNFDLIFFFCVILGLVFFFWQYWKMKDKGNIFSEIDKSQIIYEEKTASGCSLKSSLTRNGGARNCLLLVVTDSVLLIAPIFPFSVLLDMYDLEHKIMKKRIVNISEGKVMWRKSLTIDFTDDEGLSHTVQIEPNKSDKFLTALGR